MTSALNLGLGRHRVPLVLQTEAAECGLACLAMVAGAHGLHTDLAALRRRYTVSLKGLTLADVVRMAEGLQLQSRALRAELDELDQLQTPCILHWDLNHFVVLVSVKRGVVTLHDPAHGLRRLKLAQVSPHFTGVALELLPGPGFTPARETRAVRVRELLGPVSGFKRALAQVLLLALALEVFVLLSPFFMQWVVDDVLVSGDRDLLLTLGVGFALLVGLQVLTAAGRAWAVLVLSATLNLQWLLNVFGHLLRLPVDWFERRHIGDIWSRFAAVQHIQKALTTSFAEAVLDGLMVVLTLVMMLVYSPRLTAVALLAVAAYALLRMALMRPLRNATEEALVHEARQNSHFVESLRGVQAIKLFGAQADRRHRFASLVSDTMNADIATRKLELGLSLAHRLLFGLERVAVIWLGALLVLERSLSVGMLFAFFAYKEQFAQRVAGLIDKWAALRLLRVQAQRLADIVLTPPEADAPANAALPEPAPGIELVNVSFRYADGEPEVLHRVNLRIEPGESVAITGASGCGKTTLLKIMLGVLEPTEGEVRIGGQGGVPLQRLGLQAWRQMVGVVMQDEPLFSGSVADNISFFDSTPDRAWIEQCARVAAVHDEISAMPMGYHTLIGELGTALSGGQKQRVLLARALYKRPRILLLDEATSALDVDRERIVNHAVRQLALTRVIVAHRPETIASATRVIALHDGRVAQDLRSVPPSSSIN
jgi:ATP-binding cassette subfamily B protein RaxB